MSRRKPRTLKVDSPRQLRALRTPLRQELVRSLGRLGGATVKELAGRLGRKPASLYYHVHELAKAGILRESKRSTTGGREEAVYELAAERLVIDRTRRTPAFIDAVVDAQRATLRAAERELEASVRARAGAGRAARAGAGRATRAGAGEATRARAGRAAPMEDLALMRMAARLTRADAKRLSKMLREIAAFMERSDDPAAEGSYSLTIALARVPDQSLV